MKRMFFAATGGAILAMIISGTAFSYTMPYYGDFTDTSKRQEVDCKKIMGVKTMVALVFGQSNSANFGETPYKPKSNVYNFFDGKCYVAEDPLLGADGTKGSVWTRLGEKLVEQKMYDNVILVAAGVGGTEIKRWTVGGDLHRRILDVIRQLKKKDMKITHILWHQGESDRSLGTKKDDYKKMFMLMLEDIRRNGVDAPIYVAVATMCGSAPEGLEIQQAQRELVNTDLKIFPGPFTDEIREIEDRNDACHFSTRGLDKHADLWLAAIKYSGY